MDGLIAGVGFGLVCAVCGYLAGEKSDIEAEAVRAAIAVCESNGGLAKINSVRIRCVNGARFDTGAKP